MWWNHWCCHLIGNETGQLQPEIQQKARFFLEDAFLHQQVLLLAQVSERASPSIIPRIHSEIVIIIIIFFFFFGRAARIISFIIIRIF